MNPRIKVMLVLFMLCSLITGCADKPEKKLEENITKYKKCYTEKDYICMSSLILPSTIEEAGGTEAFIELMNTLPELLAQQGLTMDASKMEFDQHGEIIFHEEFMVSVIPTKQPVVVQGSNGTIESSVIAFSGDEGGTWFFLEGSDEGKMAIADSSPQILQKINIPAPKLKLGDITLTQKNGQWVK